MKLVDVILKEHSKAQRDKIVKYVGSDPKRFAELVNVFLAGPYRVTQRASWPLSICVEEHPELIKPHLSAILKNVRKPGQHDAVKRNTVRLLQFVPIPKNLQGTAADICFEFFTDKKQPIAIRVFSMTVLMRLAQQQPELKNELIPLIEEELPYGMPAFISRAKMILKELKK